MGSLGHVLDNPLCFPVDRLPCRFAIGLRWPGIVQEKHGLRPVFDRIGAQLFTHTKCRHHAARQITCLLQVVLGTSGDILKYQRFRCTPAEEHCDAVEKFLLSVQMSVLGR